MVRVGVHNIARQGMSTLLLLLVTSCGITPGATPPLPTLENTILLNATSKPSEITDPTIWRLVLSVTGGIAGESKRIEVTSRGNASAIDEIRDQEVIGHLTAEEHTHITSLLGEHLYRENVGRPPSCADCFLYQLEVWMDEKPVKIVLNDISLPSAEVEPLIRSLQEIQSRLLTEK